MSLGVDGCGFALKGILLCMHAPTPIPSLLLILLNYSDLIPLRLFRIDVLIHHHGSFLLLSSPYTYTTPTPCPCFVIALRFASC